MVRPQILASPVRPEVRAKPIAFVLYTLEDPIKLIEWVGLLALALSVMMLIMTRG